jgi:hypothetical protein
MQSKPLCEEVQAKHELPKQDLIGRRQARTDPTTTRQSAELDPMRQFDTDWPLMILTLTGYC